MINEGLVWTYYDCSNVCYLFGEFQMSCNYMTFSYVITALFIIWIILRFMYKFAKQENDGVKK